MADVSVVVVTYKRYRELGDCLLAICEQTVTPREIIVVDNDGVSGLAQRICLEVAARNSRVPIRYLMCPLNSLPAARNLGIRNVDGAFVAMIDDDVLIDFDFVELGIRFLEENPQAVGVQGYFDPGQRGAIRTAVSWLTGDFYLQKDGCRVRRSISATYPRRPTGPVSCEWISGSNQLYRTRVLREILWDEALIAYSDGEDIDHSFRVHGAYPGGLWLLPTMRLEHLASQQGRAIGEERTLMREVYSYYLSWKLFPDSLAARLAYGWSRGSWLALELVRSVFSSDRARHRQEFARLARSLRFVYRERWRLRNGDLADINPLLVGVGSRASDPSGPHESS